MVPGDCCVHQKEKFEQDALHSPQPMQIIAE